MSTTILNCTNALLFANVSSTNGTLLNATSLNCTSYNSTSNGTTFNGSTTTSKAGGCELTFEEQLGITCVYGLIVVVGLIGNILVAAVILGNKSMRKSTNYFILSMAIADLLVILVTIPQKITGVMLENMHRWIFKGTLGLVLCKTSNFLNDLATAVSIFSLILITFDRFFAVVFPLKYHIMSSTNCKCLIALSWIVGSGMHAVYFYVFDIFSPRAGLELCVSIWKSKFQDPHLQKNYYLSMFCILAIIPFGIMVIAYTFILVKLRYMSMPLGDSVTEKQRRQREQRERKVLRMAVAIVMSFACCWAPFNVMAFLNFFVFVRDNDLCLKLRLSIFCGIPAYLFSALNPVIVFSFSENFRQGLKMYLSRLCPGLECLKVEDRTTSTRVTRTQVTVYCKENEAYEEK